MSRYPIKNKLVYPKRGLDPYLVEYLERWSGRKLTKLRKAEAPEGTPFTRWYLEGIRNISYSNNTGNPLSQFHSAIRLPLQEFFGEDLLRVLSSSDNKTLILDFKSPEGIFKRIPPEEYEEWKDKCPADFRAAENKRIKIPHLTLWWFK